MEVEEKTTEKRPRWKSYVFPPQVYLILGNELCERFCYYGLRTVLAIYLAGNFGVSESVTVIIYHIFNTLVYFTPLLGAVLSDSFIGRYKTILYLSLVYASGNILLAVTSIPSIIDTINLAGPAISLFLIAVGTGGIKPCVCAFGAEQFSDKDTSRLEKYFAIFYFSINFGSLISMFLTPVIRSDVRCFGKECYLAAFGVPAIFFIVAFIFFLAGTKFYKTSKPENNVLLDVAKTSLIALKGKIKAGKDDVKPEHWLDYALNNNNRNLIEDIKALYKVLFLFIPLPIFWTLYDQQGSRWVFQALKMNGNIPGGGLVQPDQLQAVNAGLVLLFIPLFDSIIYPLFGKCGMLKNLLHRMIAGMILVSLSFFSAAILEYEIKMQTPVKNIPNGNITIRMINLFDTSINFHSIRQEFLDFTVNPGEHSPYYVMSLGSNYDLNISYEKMDNGVKSTKYIIFKPDSSIAQAKKSYTLTLNHGIEMTPYLIEDITEGISGYGKLRVMIGTDVGQTKRNPHKISVGGVLYNYPISSGHLDIDARVGKNDIFIDDKNITIHYNILAGAVYTLSVAISSDGKFLKNNIVQDVEPPPVHLLWQIAQYVVLTAGEILFSITGLDFAYREAPPSMKSCVIAAWYVTTSIGNLIVVIFAEVKISEDMAIEFTIFGFLLIVTAIIFSVMANQYTKSKLVRKRNASDLNALEETAA